MFVADRLTYNQTGYFSKIVIDYLDRKNELKPFYSFTPTLKGIQQAIQKKQQHKVDRKLLHSVLHQQYQQISPSEQVQKNIELLLHENTFTICTAHQPNLFTGPLYFIYKILHAIRLANYLNAELTQYKFVPVFYMGCEDADLEELNNFTVQGKRYVWQTRQQGAVGRMKVDKQLLDLINELQQQITVESFGGEWTELLKVCFTEGKNIQTATFELINHLFGDLGLLVLIPDVAELKREMIPIFEDDLFRHIPLKIVEQTSEKLQVNYDVQAHARPINLFYLKDDVRERIELKNTKFQIRNSQFLFSELEIHNELLNHPERFSPNVILRGLLQEKVLPNIVFIGGGGELAYWLQLKDLFEYYGIPFPVQVLRNSFLIVEKKSLELMLKLQLQTEDLFLPEIDLLNKIITREGKKPELNGEMENLQSVYQQLKTIAASYDPTLGEHVEALKTKTISQIHLLQKKMLRAERKKHEATQRQIARLKQLLFPNENLQERVENIGGYYSRWGQNFINTVYQHSPPLEQEFVVLVQQNKVLLTS